MTYRYNSLDHTSVKIRYVRLAEQKTAKRYYDTIAQEYLPNGSAAL